jgi:carboxyl-terminal processing protease
MRNAVFFLLFLIFATPALAVGRADTSALKPRPVYGKEARVISYILDNNHYRKIQLNDSLSSAILDTYIAELDDNKMYFTAADIAAFGRFRYVLDDLTRNEDVTPAYEIYQVFRKRFRERMEHVTGVLLNTPHDFTLDEYHETNRDKQPWAKSVAELDEVWRKTIKSQALSLRLTGKTDAEIKDLLKTRYDRFIKNMGQFNSEDVFSLYMNAITEAYDPHTNYMSPKASALFKQGMSLSLEGVGAQLQLDNDYTKVVRILPGGPADRTKKLQVNDLIIGVAQGNDGEMVDVVGWRLDDVVKLIKGPKGTIVRLQILPAATGMNGRPKEETFVRDKIKLEDQSAKKQIIHYSEQGKTLKLGVITLPSFYMDFEEYQKGNANYTSTTRDVKRMLLELQAEKIDGLVVDLRNNGGGSLAEAIDLTGLFIRQGPVVQVKNSANQIQLGADEDQTVAYGGPLVVLTNRFSASASEIFAGAIQDYHRGVIVGESTFGKGTVQTVLDLKRFINDPEEVGELKLTFQKFYRVTGSSTQNKGVVPDILLPSAFEASEYGESALPAALPWDVIRGTPYQRADHVSERVLAGLSKKHEERLRLDAQLRNYLNETAELRRVLNQTSISLNESKRKEEMAAAESRKKKGQSLNTKIETAEGRPADLSSLEDEYLREGLLILTDLLNRRLG